MRVIYIDELFFINLIANYFLLLGTAKICGIAALRRRLWLASALGAAYAVLCAIPATAFLSHVLINVPIAAAMLIIAFGWQKLTAGRRLVRVALVFFALAMCAAGAVTAIGLLGGRINLRVFVLAFGACYAIATLVFRRAGRDSGRMSQVRIEVGERAVTLRALVDTGNSLTDPLSGARVCVVSLTDVLTIVPESQQALLENTVRSGGPSALVELGNIPGGIKLRLVPYSTVGTASGMLLAFRPDRITVDGRESHDHIVAVSPNEVADNVTYSALI